MSDPKPLRLLVLGINYAPEPIGIGPYTTGLCEGLVVLGDTVEAVVGEAYYPQWRRYADQPKAGIRNAESGVGVTRCRHYIPASPSGARRILHLLSFSLSALFPALKRARKLKPDVVIVVAPSLLAVPVGWLAARMARAMLWVHVQDFEVEAAFATGLLAPRGLAARLARWTERRLFALADRVSTISPNMLVRLGDKGVLPERRYELRNWASAAFAPDSLGAQRYRAEWSLGNCKVALYSGNIANKQGVESVIEAAALLRHRDDIAFVICGEGPNRAGLTELAKGLPNIRLHGLQPAARMGGLLAMAHVHLLPQLAEAADLVLPSKLTNMLLSGRPVVATAQAGTSLASEVEGCGLVVAPGDALALAHAIASLADDTGTADRLGEAAALRAADRWDQSSIVARLRRELAGLARHG